MVKAISLEYSIINWTPRKEKGCPVCYINGLASLIMSLSGIGKKIMRSRTKKSENEANNLRIPHSYKK